MPHLRGEIIFDTGPIRASGSGPDGLYWYNYTNTDTFPKCFRSMTMFMGMVREAVADFGANVVQYTPEGENWVMHRGWDHYADPAAPTSYTEHFAPDYYVLWPGESFTLAVRITPLPDTDPDGHVIVLGRWTPLGD